MKKSIFLNVCLVINLIAVLQVVASYFFQGFLYAVAWVKPGESPFYHWVLLYIWAIIGCVPVILYLCGRIHKSYLWLIISYASFWAIAYCINSGQDKIVSNAAGLILVLLFAYLMVWRYLKVIKSNKSLQPTLLR